VSLLGRDPAAIALARFGGRLQTATLTRKVTGALNPADPAAGPPVTATAYTCEGTSFRYRQRFVDGERVRKGDCLVVLLRASLSAAAGMPQPGDSISIAPPGDTSAKVGYVVDVPIVTAAQVVLQVRGEPVG
jgi:hypothetical protein